MPKLWVGPVAAAGGSRIPWRASGTLKRYPIFYSYAVFVLLTTIVGFSVTGADARDISLFLLDVGIYRSVLGVGVTWEIYMRVLAHYPGVRRLAWMLLAIIFTLGADAFGGRNSSGAFSYVALERDCGRPGNRFVDVIRPCTYYTIPLGSNVRGIAIGYVFLVATSVLNLSFRSYFAKVPSDMELWRAPGVYGCPGNLDGDPLVVSS